MLDRLKRTTRSFFYNPGARLEQRAELEAPVPAAPVPREEAAGHGRGSDGAGEQGA